MLSRQPASFSDLVNGELVVGFENLQVSANPPPDPDPENPDQGPGAAQVIPDWCHCQNCRLMPTQPENKCCTKRRIDCITTNALFNQLVLDANVLDIAMRYREDVLVLDHPRNNENFRYAAYRQYVLWQHGRLGQGNRRIIASCVLAIRARYPSPNGVYTGFLPARL